MTLAVAQLENTKLISQLFLLASFAELLLRMLLITLAHVSSITAPIYSQSFRQCVLSFRFDINLPSTAIQRAGDTVAVHDLLELRCQPDYLRSPPPKLQTRLQAHLPLHLHKKGED